MRAHLGARILQVIPTLLLVSIYRLLPAAASCPATRLGAGRRGGAIRRCSPRSAPKLWLDRPLVIQYFHWIGNVLHGDLGFSWRIRQPVAQLILQKLPVTLQPRLDGVRHRVSVGVPMGILSAVKKNTFWDYVANGSGWPDCRRRISGSASC